MTYKNVVMFSGGVASWAAAKRVVSRRGAENTVLVFADTKIEDADLYRFLDDAERSVGVPLIRVADGRTPWEVFRDVKFIGNSRVDPCSKVLKRDLLDRWLDENCERSETTVHLGIDWTEAHRFDDGEGRGAKHRLASNGWTAEAPLMWRPLLDKKKMLAWLEREGIEPPRLYKLGFPHNNCGGFCIKAGHAHFAHLLKTLPEVYREHEEQEARFQRETKTNNTVLRSRKGGKTTPLSLREFREQIEGGQDHDRLDWGGCGCFSGPTAGQEDDL